MDGSSPTKLQPDFKGLPSVQHLLGRAAGLVAAFGHAATVAALRAALDDARATLRAGGPCPAADALLDQARSRLDAAPRLVRVINATGMILHTNLGRAPLAAEAVAAVVAAAGYCTLEFDLASGSRGSRTQAIEPLLRQVTGAEAGMAVNNAAAAVLLALAALAGTGEVVVSRGELIEIGGGFRIPDIIRQGGARLVEVGTTNRTRLADYRAAITPDSRVLLKVHQSNFRMSGFVEETPPAELVALAREHGLCVIHDLGSGALLNLAEIGPLQEATAQASIVAGVDVVVFSADKLLGGPQAGILAGRAAAIDAARGHPLLRALRLDKLSLAALEATLRLHATGAWSRIPALQMIAQAPATIAARAETLAALLGPMARTEASAGATGGGTLPGSLLPSTAVRLTATIGPDALAARLRAQHPAIIGRIAEGGLLLDMLTVADADLPDLVRGVQAAIAA